MNKMKINTCL